MDINWFKNKNVMEEKVQNLSSEIDIRKEKVRKLKEQGVNHFTLQIAGTSTSLKASQIYEEKIRKIQSHYQKNER